MRFACNSSSQGIWIWLTDFVEITDFVTVGSKRKPVMEAVIERDAGASTSIPSQSVLHDDGSPYGSQ